MNKKYKWIVCLGCLSALCLGATACGKTETMAEQMAKQGYVVEVIYDPGSGTFFERTGATVQDYFNPSHYTPDENGTVSITLMDPLDEDRVRISSNLRVQEFPRRILLQSLPSLQPYRRGSWG